MGKGPVALSGGAFVFHRVTRLRLVTRSFYLVTRSARPSRQAAEAASAGIA